MRTYDGSPREQTRGLRAFCGIGSRDRSYTIQRGARLLTSFDKEKQLPTEESLEAPHTYVIARDSFGEGSVARIRHTRARLRPGP